jgi:HK97 family phage portal protein
MNLFGWKSRRAPAPARPLLARGWSVGPGWSEAATARSWVDQVRAAYQDNPVAQRACRLVADAVGAAPLLADPAVAALLAARSGGQALLSTVPAQLLLGGNAYVQIIAGEGGAPGELFALRPDRVTVEVDADGWPQGFAYRVGARRVQIAADDGAMRTLLVHIRTHHPLDDHYGLGCLSAAGEAVAVHNAAARWNRALLDNAARPSGALVLDSGETGATLAPAQFDRLREQMEAAFQGAGNAGRPLLLEGGLKWQPLSLSPADMDFAALRDGAARDIAMAFGVPPMLLGLPGDATYANYREAMKALWRQTVLPLADTILTALAQGLESWGLAGRLAVDLDRVPALAEDRERLWTQVSAADFLSPEEKRALLGLGERA